MHVITLISTESSDLTNVMYSITMYLQTVTCTSQIILLMPECFPCHNNYSDYKYAYGSISIVHAVREKEIQITTQREKQPGILAAIKRWIFRSKGIIQLQ